MSISSSVIHYGVAALTITVTSISIGISEGLASLSAIGAMNRQPSARNEITKVAIIGITLIETVAILGLIMSALLLIKNPLHVSTSYAHYAELGIAAAICISGFVIGLASTLPAQAACYAVARQPFFAQQILALMIMTLILLQTPMISSFLVSLFIQTQAMHITTLSDSMRLIASGLCVGLGSIGPAIGLSLFSKATLEGVGINKNAYQKLLTFTFISEAIIETPIIFCLVIALILLFVVKMPAIENPLDGIIFLSAGLCAGLGTIAPGISSGKTAAAACTQIAKNPAEYNILSRTSMIAQGIIETIIIYSIVLALLLILFR